MTMLRLTTVKSSRLGTSPAIPTDAVRRCVASRAIHSELEAAHRIRRAWDVFSNEVDECPRSSGKVSHAWAVPQSASQSVVRTVGANSAPTTTSRVATLGLTPTDTNNPVVQWPIGLHPRRPAQPAGLSREQRQLSVSRAEEGGQAPLSGAGVVVRHAQGTWPFDGAPGIAILLRPCPKCRTNA